MANWVIPCNPKYYNHEGAFASLDYIDWRQSTNVEKGDTVYIYVGRPVSSLLYKCIAIEVDMFDCDRSDTEYNISNELSGENKHRWMRLVLKEKYTEGKLPRLELLDNGLKTIQGPCKVDSDFDDYVEHHK